MVMEEYQMTYHIDVIVIVSVIFQGDVDPF